MDDNFLSQTAHSEAIEDFLKAVYLLQQEHARVQTSMLAEALSITPPSTTEMAKKLARANLITHELYKGVRLTPTGERVAIEIVRNHRLIELFLVQALGFGWDEVHREAERLEHVISEQLAERIAQYLGNPHFDPHGDPIPSPEGDVEERALTPLSALALHTPGIVARLRDQAPDMLRYLGEKGLVVGAHVEVIAIDPFEGPLTVQVDGQAQVIGSNVAHYVLVSHSKGM
ncbi:MAG TPA: metal-dependent transcriptional regulator [Aggregatilineaceae bacterium]|nr:metal-dependent transcriptional regulator [Aggregatilineaceae bacterium]